MLAVARGVLERVHAGVFEALQARAPGTPPGTPGPTDLADWDVRTVLRTLRGQVQRVHKTHCLACATPQRVHGMQCCVLCEAVRGCSR